MSATISLCPPSPPVQPLSPRYYSRLAYCLLRSLGQKCIWQTVTRRGAARLISAKSIVPVNAAAQRRVAGNCLSARETSRWNFRPPPFPSFSSMSWFRLKIFRRISRVDNFRLCDRRELWRMGNRRFFFENREGKLFFQGEACGGRIKRTSISVRNCDYSKIFMVNDFRNARGIITSWKWNFGFNQNEIVNVGLEYYKRRTYYA